MLTMSASAILLSMCLSLMTANCQNPLEQGVKDLFKLLEPVPPKGTPFPKIPGPKLSDQVCIVGAGPSGIHMALMLKKKGYKKVKIYEKTNRVGGKSYDIDYRGVPNALGTSFLEPSYFDTVVPLAKQYGVGDLIELPSVNVWKTNSANNPGSKLRSSEFILGSIGRMTNQTSPQKNLGVLLGAITRYIEIHRDLFGTYKGALMRKPSKDVFDRISGTFLEFLEREKLHILTPVLTFTTTLQGYGQLDEVSALYGLMWNNPRFMVSSFLRGIKKAKTPFNSYVFKHGFEIIWKTIVEAENLDIRFNSDLYSLRRRHRQVDLKLWKGSHLKKEVCHFLVWTAPASELLRTLSDASHEEWSLLGSLKPITFTTNLVNMKNEVRNGPYVMYYENIRRKVDHGVTGEFSLMGLMTTNLSTPDVLEKYDQDNDEIKTVSVLQSGKEKSNEKNLNDMLVKHYRDGFNATDIEILHTISWSYFPRWNPQQANEGRHWQVFDMQGVKNMWYAGASVCHESIKDVLEYNNLLLRQMV